MTDYRPRVVDQELQQDMTDKHGDPVALIVINGGRFTYRRPDGVTVVPVALLGP